MHSKNTVNNSNNLFYVQNMNLKLKVSIWYPNIHFISE